MPRYPDVQQQVPLPVPVLVSRLLAQLDTCAHLVEQVPAGALREPAAGHAHGALEVAYRASQTAVGFLDAALGGRLTREHLERRPPEHLRTAADVARLTRSVSQAVAVWWGANQARLPASIDTFEGQQPLDAVLERTVDRVTQQARQLGEIARAGERGE